MTLAVPVVSSDECRRHEPLSEIWVGVTTRGTELPERMDVIRAATLRAGAPQVAAEAHDDRILRAVHDDDLLGYLSTVWERWVAAGFLDDPGQPRVVPYLFPVA